MSCYASQEEDDDETKAMVLSTSIFAVDGAWYNRDAIGVLGLDSES